jgi:hypothetical protein
MNVRELAKAFVEGRAGRCHNAEVYLDPHPIKPVWRYKLHRSIIASRYPDGEVLGDWCGWHTPTTANHLNHIRNALGVVGAGSRLSYAWARDHDQGVFDLRDPKAQEDA